MAGWGRNRVALALIGLLITGAACSAGSSPSHGAMGTQRAAVPSTRTTPSDWVVVTHVPAHHKAAGVVVLHSYAHGVAELIQQGWNTAADKYGFVAIYPSRGPDWNAGLCCGTAARQNRDDVRWLTDQIRRVKQHLGLRTIYLAGNSNGGMMVERLVTESPRLTSRFAVWAAAPEMPNMDGWNGHAFLYYGSDDATVPRQGGIVQIGGESTVIEPGSRLNRCLPNAKLTSTVVPGSGHAPPAYWPELAWAVLSSPLSQPASGAPCPS